MKKIIVILLACVGLLGASELQKPLYGFLNTSINYLDWSHRVENEPAREDFAYLEVEGGAFWEWGSVYAFVDLENPTRSWEAQTPKEQRISSKGIVNLNVSSSGWSVYIQDYHFESQTFYVNNLIGGLGYAYVNGGLFARGFLTAHYQRSTYYDGENGYMGGWFWRYDFEAWGKKWYAFQWHEVEFERSKEHYMLSDGTRIGDGASWGLNGDIALFFRATDALDLGMQYRYAYQKLGLSLYQNGMIYSLKYNF